MNTILQAVVILYGVMFRADVGQYTTEELCQQAAKIMAGENWQLVCTNQKETNWYNGYAAPFCPAGYICRDFDYPVPEEKHWIVR